jgi:hypothetical protein
MTTGDRITPSEIDYKFPLSFDNRKISILAYTLETILSEKIETILSRSTANSRPRDFYDAYILSALRRKKYRLKILKQALDETATKRGSVAILRKYENIIKGIESDAQMNRFWTSYKKEFSYAKDLEFAQACDAVR